MKIRIIGSGNDSMALDDRRSYSSLLVDYDGKNYLFDCGDYARTRKKLKKVNSLLLTQPKWDKIIGFYEFLHLKEDKSFIRDINVVCNKSTYARLRSSFRDHTNLYDFKVFGDKAFKTFTDNKLKITAFPVVYSSRYPTHGYKVSNGKTTIVYTPACKGLNPKVLKGVDYWITDGEGIGQDSYLHMSTEKIVELSKHVKHTVLVNLPVCSKTMGERFVNLDLLTEENNGFACAFAEDGEWLINNNSLELSSEELKRISKTGVLLSKYHIQHVFSGFVKGIVRTSDRKDLYNKEVYLVDGNFVYGRVKINKAKRISREEFRALSKKHKMGEFERIGQFGNKNKLFYYDLKVLEMFDTPVPMVSSEVSGLNFVDDLSFQVDDLCSGSCNLSEVNNPKEIPSYAKKDLKKIYKQREEKFKRFLENPSDGLLDDLYDDEYLTEEEVKEFVKNSFLEETKSRIVRVKDRKRLNSLSVVVAGLLASANRDERKEFKERIKTTFNNKDLEDLFNKFSSRFEVIIRTESKSMSEEGRLREFNDRGVEKVIFRVEPGACPICQSYANKVFKLGTQPVITADTHPNCFDKETEVLTNNGWKLFKEVKKDDLILSVDLTTGNSEWVGIKHFVKYKLKDELVHYTNNRNDFMVTKNHNHVVKTSKSDFWELKQEDELPKIHNSHIKFLATIPSYKGLDKDLIQISNSIFKTEEFVEFLGYYLSEGSISKKRGKWQLKITQNNDRYYDLMVSSAKKLFNKVWCGKNQFYVPIVDEGLGDWFRSLGKNKTKYVPEIVKELDKKYLKILLDAFIKGDGSVRKARFWKDHLFSGERIYFTASNQLASDIGELILKIGKRPSYTRNKKESKLVKFSNGEYISNPVWIIRENKITTASVLEKQFVSYDDFVYDVELDKYHTLFVRRNGKVLLSGNCRCHYEEYVTKGEEKKLESSVQELSFDAGINGFERLSRSVNDLKIGLQKDKIVRVVALASGIWNRFLYDYDRSGFEENMKKLLNKPVRVNHELAFDFGRVVRVGGDRDNGWIWADLYIDNEKLLKQVRDRQVGVSVGVNVDHQGAGYGSLVTISDFGEISLTSNPACYKCVVAR